MINSHFNYEIDHWQHVVQHEVRLSEVGESFPGVISVIVSSTKEWDLERMSNPWLITLDMCPKHIEIIINMLVSVLGKIIIDM